MQNKERIIKRNVIHTSPARSPAQFVLRRRIAPATINYTVPWKIFVVACVGIFEKEYQSAYWIVGAGITLWLDSKSGSRDVYCYRNDIEGTTCLHRASINPLATASKFPQYVGRKSRARARAPKFKTSFKISFHARSFLCVSVLFIQPRVNMTQWRANVWKFYLRSLKRNSRIVPGLTHDRTMNPAIERYCKREESRIIRAK